LPVIQVEHLVKDFRTAKRDSNLLRYMFRRTYEKKRAVDDVSFSIDKGELVGYIGPNGAGKSTTIKVLTGILYPTTGRVSVLGNTPSAKRKQNAFNIGVVFGQRTQLWWDLPVIDSFGLLRKIYKIPDNRFQDNFKEMSKLLDLDSFINKPVRQISLGQRMRADLAAAFLHSPQVLFLDEPTIGLDVVVKKQIRTFIRKMRDERNITVILTTHDMRDIEEICERTIIIDKGKIVLDMNVTDLKNKLGDVDTMTVYFENEPHNINITKVKTVEKAGLKWTVTFRKKDIPVPDLIAELTKAAPIDDISIKEPDIEDIVRDIYEDR
jgi:ABC-2 type transport system ATP-binding protein